jgi:hypothetical protein
LGAAKTLTTKGTKVHEGKLLKPESIVVIGGLIAPYSIAINTAPGVICAPSPQSNGFIGLM